LIDTLHISFTRNLSDQFDRWHFPGKFNHLNSRMWEIQPDWCVLDRFFVRIGGQQYSVSRSAAGLSCSDAAVRIVPIQSKSFSITVPVHGTCTFLAPTRSLNIHSGVAITAVDLTPDGTEVFSGDSQGHLFLTYIGTDPVPFNDREGPTDGFDIAACLVDPAGRRLLAASLDFRFYEYSSTEYELIGHYQGHTSALTRLHIHDSLLYSSSRDRTIIQWNSQARQPAATISLSSPINDFCFTASSAIFAACDTAVLGWDLRAGQTAVSPEYSRKDVFLSVCSENDQLSVGLENGRLVQWDLRNLSAPISEWAWFDAPLNRLQYINGHLWVGGNDGTTACVDGSAHRASIVLGTKAYAPVRDFATNGIGIWTGNGDGLLQYFDL
jgi:WD40 repeat protein